MSLPASRPQLIRQLEIQHGTEICYLDLEQAYVELIKLFEKKGLFIAPDKVQKDNIINYLGAQIFEKQIIL